MKRLHLFEIHDQDWCPHAIRDAETDYLQFVIAKAKSYAPTVSILTDALQRTGTRQVLDLCSGAGGPWPWLHPVLAERGVKVSVWLTDKYPNVDALDQSTIHLSRSISGSTRHALGVGKQPRGCVSFGTQGTSSSNGASSAWS